MELFPSIPEDFGALSDEDLQAFADDTAAALAKVTADPQSFTSEDVSSAQLLKAAKESHEALRAANEALADRVAASAEEAEESDEITDEAFAAEMEAISTDVAELSEAPEGEEDREREEDEGEEEPETAAAEEAEALAASAEKKKSKAVERRPLPAARGGHRVKETTTPKVPLVAAAGASPSVREGQELSDLDIAKAMIDRRRHMGVVASGTEGDRITIAKADWSHLYPDERRLTNDEVENLAVVAAAFDQASMLKELRRREEKSLVATGGLCAPVTPYYQLQMISGADRPVRGALAAFNADRGGIRYARPAALSVIDTTKGGVGYITAEEDGLGGTNAAKSCQVVECPEWEEVDVAIIYHCLQFGNLGARTFPERVTQWNQLTLAAHARVAEGALLDGIDDASTEVTAGTLGLGATASFLGQILAAAVGMRSRHRMSTDAVLRLMLPWWAPALLVSDVIRSQFQRFDTDEARITALLRSFNIEPSFYLDTANGRAQVFPAQSAGTLLEFPAEIVAYLYPEGSFLYVDGGTLELGLVRDSVLNSTNDFQIFGETFENVAFVGVESLAIVAHVCDSGITAGTHDVACPINNALAS